MVNSYQRKTQLILKLFLFFLLNGYIPQTTAQTLADSISSFFRIIQSAPQEKIYLHLDKPFYGAGEKIWFKGYLRNAITHKDDTKSNFFIVELLNRQDSVIIRQKIRKEAIGFRGCFDLPAELPQGDYYIKAYSNWMLNGDPDFLYSRPIKIGNSIDVSILSHIEYQQEDDQHYIGKVKFTDHQHFPFEKIKINYILYNKDKTEKKELLLPMPMA